MDNIDPAKALAALAQLEAERARRLQEKIDAGQVLVVNPPIVIGDPAEEAEVVARAKEWALKEHVGREIHWDPFVVITGVPQAYDDELAPTGDPLATLGCCPLEASPVAREQNAEAFPPLPETPETHVYVVLRNGTDDGDPGTIADGFYKVEDGQLTVTNLAGEYLAGRRLSPGDDPDGVARALLRETIDPVADFNRVITYPRLGIA
jgi:hypothetical protein